MNLKEAFDYSCRNYQPFDMHLRQGVNKYHLTLHALTLAQRY